MYIPQRNVHDGFLSRSWALCCLLGLLCLAAFSTQAEIFSKDAPAYLHRIWRNEDGLPHPYVRGVLQSHSGYLWVASEEGLDMFDGVRFTSVERRTSLGPLERWMVGLTEAKDGSIWFSSVNGGLGHWQQGAITYYHRKDGLPSDYVLSVREDDEGDVWVGTATGLALWRNGKFFSNTNETGFVQDAVRAIVAGRDGTLWIGSSRGLWRRDGNQFSVVSGPGLPPTVAISSLCEDKKGFLWVGTSQGLYRWDGGRGRKYTTAEGLAHNIVRAVRQDADGMVWVGTQGGLQQWRDGEFINPNIQETTAPDFEGINFVYTLAEDREGDLWVGTPLGLSRLQKQKFKTISKMEGLAHNLTTVVMEDHEKTLWVGTYGGGLTRFFDDGRKSEFNSTNGLPNDFILALAQSQDKTYWIGSENGGLTRLRDGMRTYKISDQPQLNSVRAILEDRQGNLWLGTGGGAFLFANGKALFQTNIPRTAIHGIMQDRGDNVWFATKFGLARWHAGNVEVYRATNGLLADFVTCIAEDREGGIWAGTEAGGIQKLGPDGSFLPTFTDFKERIYSIQDLGDGRFWLGGRNGIFSVSKERLQRYAENAKLKPDFATLGRKDGLRRSQCSGMGQPAGWVTQDGEIWFSTMFGAVGFNPAAVKKNQVLPPVVIEKVIMNGKPVELGGRKVFAPGQGNLEIEYTALSFPSPELVFFQYQLEGFDLEWRDAGTQRRAQFASLPAGRYTFRIRACNNDGVWNQDGAEFAFTIEQPLYKSWISYVLGGLALVGLGWGLTRWRVAALKKREAELELLIARRTSRLQELLKSMESFNYSIAHDLRAPMRAIRGLTQALVEDCALQLDDLGRDYARRIDLSVERMDRLIQDLLTYGQIMHKEVPIERIEPEEHINKILQLLQEEILSRNVQVEVKTPLPPVLGNSIILEQIFLNLIGNAMKFTAPGRPPQIKIYAEETAQTVKIYVADNGIGIAAEHYERIFRIFERLHSDQKYPGTGIGLAIVQRGAERINGKVGLASEVGQGSRFWIELPKVPVTRRTPEYGPPRRVKR